MEALVLLVDAGNSYIKIALFDGAIHQLAKIPTREVVLDFSKFVSLVREFNSSRFVVSSVVPEFTAQLIKEFPKALVISSRIRLPVRIEYDSKETLGTDRIAAACGGLDFYDSFLVVSAGTAVVVDLVINRVFKGGVIFPGFDLMVSSLFEGTAGIPEFSPRFELTFPAKSTSSAVQSGCSFAVVGGVKEVLSRFEGFPVLVTGGLGEEVSKLAGGVYVEDLIFRGLKRIFFEGSEKGSTDNGCNPKE